MKYKSVTRHINDLIVDVEYDEHGKKMAIVISTDDQEEEQYIYLLHDEFLKIAKVYEEIEDYE